MLIKRMQDASGVKRRAYPSKVYPYSTPLEWPPCPVCVAPTVCAGVYSLPGFVAPSEVRPQSLAWSICRRYAIKARAAQFETMAPLCKRELT